PRRGVARCQSGLVRCARLVAPAVAAGAGWSGRGHGAQCSGPAYPWLGLGIDPAGSVVVSGPIGLDPAESVAGPAARRAAVRGRQHGAAIDVGPQYLTPVFRLG